MTNFSKQVYTMLLQVPVGKVTTYKYIAKAMNTKAYQAIGQALKNNPDAPAIPCHRVVQSSGQVGGYLGREKGFAVERKIELLRQEGVTCHNGMVQNFYQHLFTKFQ